MYIKNKMIYTSQQTDLDLGGVYKNIFLYIMREF